MRGRKPNRSTPEAIGSESLGRAIALFDALHSLNHRSVDARTIEVLGDIGREIFEGAKEDAEMRFNALSASLPKPEPVKPAELSEDDAERVIAAVHKVTRKPGPKPKAETTENGNNGNGHEQSGEASQ